MRDHDLSVVTCAQEVSEIRADERRETHLLPSSSRHHHRLVEVVKRDDPVLNPKVLKRDPLLPQHVREAVLERRRGQLHRNALISSTLHLPSE